MWRPIGNGEQRCDEHDTVFAVGHVCPNPSCVHVDAGTQAVTQAEALAAEAARRKLGGSLDRESRLVEIDNVEAERVRVLRTEADRYWRTSRNTRATAAERKEARIAALDIERVAHHLVETQRKAVVGAADLTLVREEQLGTEYLERAAGAIDAEAN